MPSSSLLKVARWRKQRQRANKKKALLRASICIQKEKTAMNWQHGGISLINI